MLNSFMVEILTKGQHLCSETTMKTGLYSLLLTAPALCATTHACVFQILFIFKKPAAKAVEVNPPFSSFAFPSTFKERSRSAEQSLKGAKASRVLPCEIKPSSNCLLSEE